MSGESDERVADLEIRLMHQEDTIDALTETLVRQQKVIDQLQQQLESLRGRVSALEEQRSGGESEENTAETGQQEPPPHY